MLPPSPDTSHFDSRTVQCQNSYKICQRPRKEMHQAQKVLTASRHQQNLTSFSFCLNECLASLQNSCKELKHTQFCSELMLLECMQVNSYSYGLPSQSYRNIGYFMTIYIGMYVHIYFASWRHWLSLVIWTSLHLDMKIGEHRLVTFDLSYY